MTQRYRGELAHLARTYEQVIGGELSQLEELVRRIRVGPAVFVGSGGALPLAYMAANLHTAASGKLSTAATPLELVAMPPLHEASVVLFSARALNPDAAMAVDTGLRLSSCVGLVTQQRQDRIPSEVARSGVSIAEVPAPRDGFLATNSVLATATALCLAYGFELPASLPSATKPSPEPLQDQSLILFGPRHRSVALDLETRLSETGLSSSQYADLRNFAHGRHAGLTRNLDRTSVVAVISPEDRALAGATLEVLPGRSRVVMLETDLPYPASALDLLVGSMRLVSSTGEQEGMDPARPGVAPFGRKLYKLSTQRLLDLPRPDPVNRKLSEAGLSGAHHRVVADALQEWHRAVRTARITGLVLDYDGTCCSTDERYESLRPEVTDRLLGLLGMGLTLAFASGRGRSLLDTTRAWVPKEQWPNVRLALYNGTVDAQLSDSLEGSYNSAEGVLAEVAERLNELRAPLDIEVQARRTQVSVASEELTGSQLLPLVQTVLARSPALNCKAVASGHSVDVMPPGASKAALVQWTAASSGGEVMAIGDQGQPSGNDFELLASTPWSLTVDRCSPDLTRCWNLDTTGTRGPDLLLRYLDALQSRGGGAFRFAWSPP